MYGKPPPDIPDYLPGSSSVEAVDFLLTTRQDMFDALRQKLERSQVWMKNSTDPHRREVNFKIGDWVYVKLRLYRQTSIADKFQN